MSEEPTTLWICDTDDFSPRQLAELRSILDAAFDGTFTDDDFDHALGGKHVAVLEEGAIVAHGSVVERRLWAGEQILRTGYVEAVAARVQHRGHGSAAMTELDRLIRATYEIGALSTSVPDFYLGLGWERWLGPTAVKAPTGICRTPDDDGAVFVLRTRATTDLDLTLPLVCDWREGDVW